MPEGLGPRFALEAGFLILLAAVAAYARLSTTGIVLVMAGGWLLASIFEVLAARRERLYAEGAWDTRAAEAEGASSVRERPEVERRLSWFRRPAEVTATAQDQDVPAEPPPPQSREADDESTGEIELPKRRRRWFRKTRPEVSAEEGAARPSARHVRLIRDSKSEREPEQANGLEQGHEERKDAEAGS